MSHDWRSGGALARGPVIQQQQSLVSRLVGWFRTRLQRLTLQDLIATGSLVAAVVLARGLLRRIDAAQDDEDSVFGSATGAASKREKSENAARLHELFVGNARRRRERIARRKRLRRSSQKKGTADSNVEDSEPDEEALAPVELPHLNSHEWAVAAGLLLPRELEDAGFSTIGGLDSVKQELNELLLLPLRRPELFGAGRALGALPSGVLLYGPPGTGKTMLAKAVACESGMSFLNVNLSALNHGLLGESEKSIHAVFSLARKVAPCVIFVDEIDCLLGDRDGEGGLGGSDSTFRQKSIFMTDWDGLTTNTAAVQDDPLEGRVVLLAATNRPWSLDVAVQVRGYPPFFSFFFPPPPGPLLTACFFASTSSHSAGCPSKFRSHYRSSTNESPFFASS
jgi:ATPase family associated with various cellular activities (AAA)